MRVIVLLGVALVLAPGAQADVVTGNITTDTTWDRAGNPWTVATNVVVKLGATLEVEAGTVVEFTANWKLETDSTTGGAIVVQGAPYDSVYFRAQGGDGSASQWQGIQVNVGAGSSFDHMVVLHAKTGLKLNASNAAITHCAFRRCRDGIWCARSSPNITSSWVSETSLAGIMCDGSSPTPPVSQPVILDCNLFDNAGPSVYMLGYSGGGVVTVTARNNWWGTTVEAEIQDSIYDGNDSGSTGFVDYANWREQVPVEHRTWGSIKALFRD